MLLNLSNHPSDFWSLHQISDAQMLYGNVVDMEFPLINPSDSFENISQLADKYLIEILKMKPAAVHIMGEMTFTFNLVHKLLAHQIPCIASTTERITVTNGDAKTSTFRFVQFRSYSL